MVMSPDNKNSLSLTAIEWKKKMKKDAAPKFPALEISLI
jgi:hypothetical protein